MSIQSYVEKFLSELDVAFEKEANSLLNDVRQCGGKHQQIAGRIDGLHESANIAKETYKLFVDTRKDEDENAPKAIY